jgi:hypothetical protein
LGTLNREYAQSTSVFAYFFSYWIPLACLYFSTNQEYIALN